MEHAPGVVVLNDLMIHRPTLSPREQTSRLTTSLTCLNCLAWAYTLAATIGVF